MSVLQEIGVERQRQIEVEGWSLGHDDGHRHGELVRAAVAYALSAGGMVTTAIGAPNIWPWDRSWWKPKNPRRDLILAGALIVAEIERLDRVPETEARMFAWTDTNPDAR